MAGTTLSKATNVKPAKSGLGLIVESESFSVATGALNDYWDVFKVPAGATIIDAILAASDLDTNGSPTIAFGVGDSSSASRLISASTVGRTGAGADRLNVFAGFLYQYTTETIIRVTVTQGAATFQAGTVKLAIKYTLQA